MSKEVLHARRRQDEALAMTHESQCGSRVDATSRTQRRRSKKHDAEELERELLSSRMRQIRRKIMILSGKGGVGKSTVAVNLATSLAMAGRRVGLLDVDLHGPSVPKLLHLEGRPVSGSKGNVFPLKVESPVGMLGVMSIGLLLHARDEAMVWRGPRKVGVIKQLLTNVEWGELDYLVVDAPPGTGDEPLCVAELVENASGAVIVTTPQELAVQDARRCIVFCRDVGLAVLGVVENMSGFTCPTCREHIPIFGADGGRIMAEEMGVPYLGSVPIETIVVAGGDSGVPFVQAHPHSETARAFGRVVRRLLERLPPLPGKEHLGVQQCKHTRIAVPVTQGNLSPHFGDCEQFALFDIDTEAKTVRNWRLLTPTDHEPGAFPRWLREQGATLTIAAGVDSRARGQLADNGISVVVGAPDESPLSNVRAYLEGNLRTGSNACDQ
jgi:ATP-binding protein involved in chromosome partitioning